MSLSLSDSESVTSDNDHPRHICSYCQKGFVRRYNLKRHVKTIHGSGDSGSDEEKSESEESDDENGSEGDKESDMSASEESDDEAIETFLDLYDNKIHDIYDAHHDDIKRLAEEYIEEGMNESDAFDKAVSCLLPQMRKRFQKEIIESLTIAKGMEKSARYCRIFDKIDKYADNDMPFHEAIQMAVKKQKSIFDNDLNDYIQEFNEEAEEAEDDVDIE